MDDNKHRAICLTHEVKSPLQKAEIMGNNHWAKHTETDIMSAVIAVNDNFDALKFSRLLNSF